MLPPLLLVDPTVHVGYRRTFASTSAPVQEASTGSWLAGRLQELHTSETTRWGGCYIWACACVCSILLIALVSLAWWSLSNNDLGLANSTSVLHTSDR
jgi:hypothetical protein